MVDERFRLGGAGKLKHEQKLRLSSEVRHELCSPSAGRKNSILSAKVALFTGMGVHVMHVTRRAWMC